MKFLYTLAILLAFACTEAVKKSNEASAEVIGKKDTTRVEKYYHSHVNDSLQSTSLGSVSNGKLKTSGIYITKNLSKVINDLHDDHYHVDFVNL